MSLNNRERVGIAVGTLAVIGIAYESTRGHGQVDSSMADGVQQAFNSPTAVTSEASDYSQGQPRLVATPDLSEPNRILAEEILRRLRRPTSTPNPDPYRETDNGAPTYIEPVNNNQADIFDGFRSNTDVISLSYKVPQTAAEFKIWALSKEGRNYFISKGVKPEDVIVLGIHPAKDIGRIYGNTPIAGQIRCIGQVGGSFMSEYRNSAGGTSFRPATWVSGTTDLVNAKYSIEGEMVVLGIIDNKNGFEWSEEEGFQVKRSFLDRLTDPFIKKAYAALESIKMKVSFLGTNRKNCINEGKCPSEVTPTASASPTEEVKASPTPEKKKEEEKKDTPTPEKPVTVIPPPPTPARPTSTLQPRPSEAPSLTPTSPARATSTLQPRPSEAPAPTATGERREPSTVQPRPPEAPTFTPNPDPQPTADKAPASPEPTPDPSPAPRPTSSVGSKPAVPNTPVPIAAPTPAPRPTRSL